MIDKKYLKKNLEYKIVNNKYVFKELSQASAKDDLNNLKSKLKKYSKFYYLIIKALSPVFEDGSLNQFLSAYKIKNNENNALVLNVGSGNSKIGKNICNVDFFAYPNVDIVCDIEELPFNDNSVDIILNIAVLEHIPNPQKVIDEIHRVLKKGGIIYTAFPFMQGYHASPYDFTRVTKEGMKNLHNNFELIEIKPFGGPTSGMLWVFQEWAALLLSFGSKKLHMLIQLFLMVITAPLKFLDFFLIKHPRAENISSGFIFIGRK